uniref:Uncharacterized protein n=1 Tax=Knipowitschia caucasica TaxID=637954 RepID=A0AAV2L693_KNICA
MHAQTAITCVRLYPLLTSRSLIPRLNSIRVRSRRIYLVGYTELSSKRRLTQPLFSVPPSVSRHATSTLVLTPQSPPRVSVRFSCSGRHLTSTPLAIHSPVRTYSSSVPLTYIGSLKLLVSPRAIACTLAPLPNHPRTKFLGLHSSLVSITLHLPSTTPCPSPSLGLRLKADSHLPLPDPQYLSISPCSLLFKLPHLSLNLSGSRVSELDHHLLLFYESLYPAPLLSFTPSAPYICYSKRSPSVNTNLSSFTTPPRPRVPYRHVSKRASDTSSILMSLLSSRNRGITPTPTIHIHSHINGPNTPSAKYQSDAKDTPFLPPDSSSPDRLCTLSSAGSGKRISLACNSSNTYLKHSPSDQKSSLRIRASTLCPSPTYQRKLRPSRADPQPDLSAPNFFVSGPTRPFINFFSIKDVTLIPSCRIHTTVILKSPSSWVVSIDSHRLHSGGSLFSTYQPNRTILYQLRSELSHQLPPTQSQDAPPYPVSNTRSLPLSRRRSTYTQTTFIPSLTPFVSVPKYRLVSSFVDPAGPEQINQPSPSPLASRPHTSRSIPPSRTALPTRDRGTLR